MKETILITGASSGIGLEMAKILAEQKYNLILVARNEKKLEELKTVLVQLYGIQVTLFGLDLSKKENAYLLYEKIINNNLQVDWLVNNAGIGNYGEFTETSLEDEVKMIDLNISAVSNSHQTIC